MRIILASQNAHKLAEIGEITENFGMELVSMKDAGLGSMEIEENGSTLEENSLIKAEAIVKLINEPAIADDTGLCVDALNGAPGIYSARFAGEHGNDAANRAKLLELLKGLPPEKRTATFYCIITMLYPDGKKLVARGCCPGRIAVEEDGDHGFGYDRVFIPDGYEQSFARLPHEIKNTIGHRADALRKLKAMLEEGRH